MIDRTVVIGVDRLSYIAPTNRKSNGPTSKIHLSIRLRSDLHSEAGPREMQHPDQYRVPKMHEFVSQKLA